VSQAKQVVAVVLIVGLWLALGTTQAETDKPGWRAIRDDVAAWVAR